MKLHGAALAARNKRLAKERRKAARKRTPTTTKKGRRTMAKGKKRKSGKKGRRRGGGGGGNGLSGKEAMVALGAAALYGYLGFKAEKATGTDMAWWKKDIPVITSVGRAGTVALIALGLWKVLKIAPKWTKPIAYGIGAVALVNLARRGFETYATEAEARAVMAGDERQINGARMGEVDLVDIRQAAIDAEGYERPGAREAA